MQKIALHVALSLEEMNAKINANKLLALYCTVVLTGTVVFAGKIKLTLICNFIKDGLRERAQAKYESALSRFIFALSCRPHFNYFLFQLMVQRRMYCTRNFQQFHLRTV